jgi:YD repeat-containing protein
MSHPLSRRGLLGSLLAAAAALVTPSPQPPSPSPAAPPPPPALPPAEGLGSWTYTYDYDGNLVSIDDGMTLSLTCTRSGLPTAWPPPEPPRPDPTV